MPTVLVVDDDADTVESLKRVIELDLAPVRVLTTSSSERALRTLTTSMVDVLVADYRMPGMNGLDLILRSRKVRTNLAAFLITAYPDPQVAAVAINRARVAGYFIKPLDSFEFVESLAEALSELDLGSAFERIPPSSR